MVMEAGRWFEAIAAHAGSAYLRYSFTKGTHLETQFLWDILGLQPGVRVLDVGCGPGRHVAALAERGADVVGVDVSMEFLRLVAGGAVVRGDARQLPLRSGAADSAISICQGGFGLLGGRDEGLVLEELARVVRPGGSIAVTCFSAYFALRFLEEGDEFDADTGVNHERAEVRDQAGMAREFDLWTTCFTPRELRLLAERSGLRVDQVWSVGPGDYQRRPPDVHHPEWLLVATAGAAPGGRPPPDA